MHKNEFSDIELRNSYNLVSQQFLTSENLDNHLLIQSRKLFKRNDDFNSFEPEDLEVIAILAGLSFSNALMEKVAALQEDLTAVINHKSFYWVKPENLALEIAVLKWPENCEDFDQQSVVSAMNLVSPCSFDINIKGFQIHTDGCVILRVYDDGRVRKLRHELASTLVNMPTKQSSWCHIPLGRILSPLSAQSISTLKEMIHASEKEFYFKENIDELKLVFEKKWYMEKVLILNKLKLKNVCK